MHEHNQARALFDTILAHAKENELNKITRVTIALGEASGFEKELLDHSFKDHLFPESIASEADIEYEIIQLAGTCKDCDEKVVITDKLISCPKCKSQNISVSGGQDIYVKEIEGA
jgi:hydrogenase nickel incorporation protein HypA/HybF